MTRLSIQTTKKAMTVSLSPAVSAGQGRPLSPAAVCVWRLLRARAAIAAAAPAEHLPPAFTLS